MISVRGLDKTYDQSHVLAGVTLDVARGECLGVEGPAGGGKTTLLRILATLVPPTSGVIIVDGLDTVAYLFEIRRRIAFTSAACVPNDRLRVEEYARFIAGTRTGRRKAAPASEIQKALRRAGLAPDARMESLEPGDQMALALTAALVSRPAVLLIDQPFQPLDSARRALFVEWLGEARTSGTTLVMATGDDEDARALCQRVLRFDAGRIVDHVAVGASDTDARRPS